MKNVNFHQGNSLSRRTLLRGAGGTLALPFLDAMHPAFGASTPEIPRRFVSVSLSLGLHNPNLIPEGSGRGYQASRYLKALEDLRDDFTIVSGSSHPEVTGGHSAEGAILTASPIGRGGANRNTISLDQHMAKYLGNETRFPSLVLNTKDSSSPSYTANGAMIPAENDPKRLFRRLFVNDSPEERQKAARRIREGQSIMDIVGEDAKKLQRRLGAGDRDKLDAWFTSVRELEKRLETNEGWAERPKPDVDAEMPTAAADRADVIARQRTMQEIMALALQTDSTRFITLHFGGGGGVVPIEGVNQGYHNLSHHGRDPEKIEQLALVEEAILREWGEFLRRLRETREDDDRLLDRTMVLLTSNLGNASSHDNRNMPVLFAGGGFEHGQHLAFDRKNNYPLPNLYLSALQRLGLERDRFASSTGTMKGLKMA